PSALQANPPTVAFSALASTQSPPAMPLAISAKGESSLGNWRATTSTFNCGSWLSVTPASGTGPGSVSIAADLGSLSGGACAGQIVITADGITNSPLKVPVTFAVVAKYVPVGMAVEKTEIVRRTVSSGARPGRTPLAGLTESHAADGTAFQGM